MTNTKRIHKVTIKRMIDESPDTSWLGEYSDKPTSEFSIDRAHDLDCPINKLPYDDAVEAGCNCDGHGDMSRNEYQYFNPSFNYVDKNGHALPENTPAEVRKYVCQDYERMESLNRGDWCFIGIRADAELNVPGGALAFIAQEITSGGCWGFESDSGEDYLKDEEANQLAELRDQLHAIGFSKRAISAAFKNVEHENE